MPSSLRNHKAAVWAWQSASQSSNRMADRSGPTATAGVAQRSTSPCQRFPRKQTLPEIPRDSQLAAPRRGYVRCDTNQTSSSWKGPIRPESNGTCIRWEYVPDNPGVQARPPRIPLLEPPRSQPFRTTILKALTSAIVSSATRCCSSVVKKIEQR